MRKNYTVGCIAILAGAAFVLAAGSAVLRADVFLTPDDDLLGRTVNEYRASNDLAPIPVTVSLTDVAQHHARDLVTYRPDQHTDPASGMPCTLYSWSDNGNWTPLCYVSDHRYAQGMWDKPSEVTNGAYPYIGFELVAAGAGLTVARAVSLWDGSSPHRDMLLNRGVWETPWAAMGVGVYGDGNINFISVWLGRNPDPQGLATLPPDPATQIIAPQKDLQDGLPLETAAVTPGGDAQVGGFYGIWLSGDCVGGAPNYRWSISGGPEALPSAMLAELPDTDSDGSVDDYFLTFAQLARAGAEDRTAASPYTLRLEALDGGGFPIPGSESEILLLVPEPATLSMLALGGLATLRRRRRS
ncbi:MAG: PEP-CTERM sorting domain-containing protein [Phycisphaerae bacterium]|jgi:hypothetical protein|nr:PEP-CTERM sorting domain-containing protein [Phycisphaerae bacterium]